MRWVVWLIATALAAEAGVIQGVVLEQHSGLPLARTLVRLQPVPKAGGEPVVPQSVRAGAVGHFSFSDIPAGLYLLLAERPSYFPAAWGQRRPHGHGTPIEVGRDSELFAELRMRRKGALTGRVLDRNGIGIPGVPVVAYRARRPPRPAGRGISDDRGIYRIHSLDPGKYWVRTAAHRLEDGSGLLPTFGPEAREPGDSREHRVTIDNDTPDADIRPEPGTLFGLGGEVLCSLYPPRTVTVTLASETGRRQTQTSCGGRYSFQGLAPAVYEVFAETTDGAGSGFLEIFADRANDAVQVQVGPPPRLMVEARLAGSFRPADLALDLFGRRVDPAGSEQARSIEIAPGTTLAPGSWEFAVRAAGHYAQAVAGGRGYSRMPGGRREQHPDWFHAYVEGGIPFRLQITLASASGGIHGRAVREGRAAPGAPVFLWPVTESARRALNGPRQILSDTEGRFRFDGLPPGEYRLLASFDVFEADDEVLEEARAPTHRVEASQTETVDLPLWVAP